MSDANAKPEAGAMSEPLDLEEKAHALMAEYFFKRNGLRLGVRAILAMVRQEQLDSPDINDAYAIRAWWLSHTAPQQEK